MGTLNDFKYQYLQQLASVDSVSSRWKSWKTVINSKLTSKNWGQESFDLGDHLSEIFLSTSIPGRSQKTVSGAGAAWECLNTWYLNLIFWDTNVVIVRQNKQFVPECINDCLTVTVSNISTNTESDIIIYSVPDSQLFSGKNISDLNDHIKTRINKVNLFVLQCKTNWEDNSQIPMLWDMIYNSQSKLPNVSIGKNGLSPQSVSNFKYGFTTVPTGKRGLKVQPSQIKVLRVKNLTGGNYWGKVSKNNVASSMKELPSRHFSNVFNGGVVNHLTGIRKKFPSITNNFINLDFL